VSEGIQRVLVVEDHAPLRRAIAAHLSQGGAVVVEAGTALGAMALLSADLDLVICDVCLPDRSGFEVLEHAARLSPEPLKIAISGKASAAEGFRLAQLGVRAYLSKPFSLQELTEAVDRVLSEAPQVDTLVRASVGRVPMREMQQRVRSVMVDQALALTHGSRSGAARLLEVSRQAIQQIARGHRRARRPGADASDRAGPAPTDSAKSPPP